MEEKPDDFRISYMQSQFENTPKMLAFKQIERQNKTTGPNVRWSRTNAHMVTQTFESG